MSALPPRLIALSPGDLQAGATHAFDERLRAAARAGLRGVLLREPALPERELIECARRWRALLSAEVTAAAPEGARAWLGISDRGASALASGADAWQLSFRSLSLADARRALERAQPAASCGLGLSVHAPDDPAQWAGADYLIYGPVRATPSKQGVLEPTGFDRLARACALARAPLWAIGGLEARDVQAVLAAGARGLAVQRGIFGQPDPARAARAYLDELERALARRGEGT